MRALYLDLDGTLVDVRRKHYAAYVDTLRELGVAPVAAHEYWRRRREGASNADLLREAAGPCDPRFLERWVDRVESPDYVRLDSLIPGARSTLASLRRSFELVLVTMRRDRVALDEQLDDLALTRLLSDIYCRDGSPDERKTHLIGRHTSAVAPGSAVVGDSDDDVEAARELGIASICVSSGVRSARYLERLQPDQLIPTIARLPGALARHWHA